MTHVAKTPLSGYDQSTLVLASGSARRLALLEQVGVECQVDPADIDEAVLPDELPGAYVERLAVAKARAVQARHRVCTVLGADTTVVAGSACLGKPGDEAEAVRMLQTLQDGWHEVLTAVAVLTQSTVEQFVTCTRVRFRSIGQAEARAYWHTGEPADKAGGYAIQGLGAAFVERIEGSYSGVVGLPLAETVAALRRAGVVDALARQELHA